MAPAQPALKSADADRLIFRPQAGPAGDVLVAIFLRGGMDGVYAVPPFADRALHAQRKGFGVLERRHGLIALDDLFGLHPDFSPLEPLYRQRQLAIVHAVGLTQSVLSHFGATKAIEGGSAGEALESGWIGRHLAALPTPGGKSPSPLRAVAIGHGVPLVLQGSPAQAIDGFSHVLLEIPAGWDPGFSRVLRAMYSGGQDLASRAGRESLQTLSILKRLASSAPPPGGSALNLEEPFAAHLWQVAQLIKADVGLEAAVLGLSDWDCHASQQRGMAGPMQSLAAGLRGFVEELGSQMRRVVVVVLSEFGRRIAPNDAGGTDHGRGTAMFVLGGGIRGGRVYGRWPGLAADQLDESGNLRVTTDYRDVLAEIVERRLLNPALSPVFPGLKPSYLGLTD